MRRYLTDASLLFGSDVAARGLNFLTLVLLARTLQPERYGLIVIGASALEYAFLFSDWGLKTLGTREAAVEPEKRRYQPSTILAARIVLGISVFIVAELLATFLPLEPTTRNIVRVYLLAVIPYAVMLDWYLQAQRSFALITVARVLQTGILLAGVLLFVNGREDVGNVPWIQLAAIAIASLFVILTRPRRDRLIPRKSDAVRIGGALGTATALGAAAIFGQTFVVLPPLVVAEVSGEAAAGVLHAALRLVVLMLIVDRVFGALYLPAFSSHWSRAGSGTAPRIRAALRLLIPAGTALSLLGAIHARPVIELVYREQYASGALPLAIAAWFILATLLNTFFAYGLVAIGQERLYLRAGVTSGSLFVVLLLLFTFIWGVPGAAVAIVSGEVLMSILLYRHFRTYVDVHPLGPLAISLVVSAAIVTLAHLSGGTSLWLSPLYLLAFLAAMLLTRVITRKDLDLLRAR